MSDKPITTQLMYVRYSLLMADGFIDTIKHRDRITREDALEVRRRVNLIKDEAEKLLALTTKPPH